MAATTNLFIDQGSDFSAIVDLMQNDGITPLNLAATTVSSQMRRSYNSLTAYNFQAEVYDEDEGQIRLFLTAANSSLLRSGRYVYDVVISQVAGNTRVLEGIVTLYPRVTQ